MDLKTLYALTLAPVRGHCHRTRLESFYARQAESYDRTRRRLLQGRRSLYRSLPIEKGAVWVDMGAGTGANLETLGDDLTSLGKVHLVDICTSLLDVARERVRRNGWSNVEIAQENALDFNPPAGSADVLIFSYSLSMMPGWFAALDRSWSMLRPGGRIAVVDFFVSSKHADAERQQHAWASRLFWKAWLERENVFLSPDHIPYLQHRFEQERLEERLARHPRLPVLCWPYYSFLGRKAG